MAKKVEHNEVSGTAAQIPEALEQISSKDDLKKFLGMLLSRMDADQAAPIYVLTMMNHLLTLPDIYQFLDEENKETARAVWLRMKQKGMQLRNPPMLFGEEQS